ncbi:hypothetical protein KSS87_020374 [Heliosperma pusillum]|nr:hypothetical protein KSS87_020374 [Heliosperma pusillum]
MTMYSPEVFKTSLAGEKTVVFCGPRANKFLFSNEGKLVNYWLPRSVAGALSYPKTNTNNSLSGKPADELAYKFLRVDSIQKYVPLVHSMVQQHVRENWLPNKEVKVYTLAKEFIFALSCRVLINPSLEQLNDIAKPFFRLLDGIFSVPINLPGMPYYKAIKGGKLVREKLVEIIKQRRQEISHIIMGNNNNYCNSNNNNDDGYYQLDLLSRLIIDCDQNSKGSSEEEIASKVIGLMFAGFYPTSTTIAFLIGNLADHPHVYDKVLQGRLEIVKPKPVGFLCGSIPVPTDKSFRSFSSDLIPSSSSQTVSAPRYRMLPTETDLNMPPDTVLPVPPAAVHPTQPPEGVPWDDGAVTSNLSRKGEALAVSGLVEYGDEIDVIAPADIIKQIFKMPYSKARLSIAVHRVGQTLILNAGPDIEEAERLVRKNQPKSSNESLFLNFAMHSVRMEACDCPPTHFTSPKGDNKSSILRNSGSSVKPPDSPTEKLAAKKGPEKHSDYSKGKKDSFYWENRNKRNKVPRRPVQETEKNGTDGNNEFLRVQFWQFHNFRMLLGSDLLVFSNEKYVSVSLHLWDISRQVTPLAWLEAWLDNVMASVPELAICYHRNGVVKSYELLKTDDIFLVKGVSEDGCPAFHPYVVQQNGLSVLRFLQANCKQDPGAYWLHKNAGEDVIQLFDLSVIPKKHSSENSDNCSNPLPSLIYRGRTESLLSLGMLLYRVAHRLSLSMAPNNRYKCVEYVRKCLELLDEPDHLVVRAYAHEQFARLILNSDEELDLAEVFPFTSEVTIVDYEEESLDIVSCISESSIHGTSSVDLENSQDSFSEASGADPMECNSFSTSDVLDTKGDDAYKMTSTSANLIQTIPDPISSKLAAVHHISQAIKSLRWTRQSQVAEDEPFNDDAENFSICACGDTDCIEVCDIREWLPTSKIDSKLWKLILLLGESYLALGQAYKEDDQLLQALKVVEVACSVYGSVPQYLDDTKFISSMGNGPHCQSGRELIDGKIRLKRSSFDNNVMDFSLTYLFWAKAWMLVGDVYVDFLAVKTKEIASPLAQNPSTQELKMSSEVVKELLRLKKKLGQDVENCTTCSLVNCSCQSDRASSGNSASSSGNSASSSGDMNPLINSRRQGKKNSRNTAASLPGDPENIHVHRKGAFGKNSENVKPKVDFGTTEETRKATKEVGDGPNSSTSAQESPKTKSGGIFRYLQSPENMDGDEILSTALVCFESAKKAFGKLPTGSDELQSVLKKIGWVCNELGRRRLQGKNLSKAEVAFAKAIDAFRKVFDHTNVILIYCNLGHGRRALAEELVSKLEYLKSNMVLRNAHQQAMDTAKFEYCRSIEFYGAAKSEFININGEKDDVLNSLGNEVFTQFAHTYLKLGMLLAREDTVAYFSTKGAMEDQQMGINDKRTKNDNKQIEISANDAIREALSIYESLGELRKQEAAYAYFQLASYQRDRCLKFSTSSLRNNSQSKSESGVLQKAKQYLSLAEWNWQKAMDFYSAKTHPPMYLTILTERAVLLSSLSTSFHSHTMLETALSSLLEGRHVSEKSLSENPENEVYTKFWRQLQMLLKTMLASSLPRSPNKAVSSPASSSSKRTGDIEKLKELYRMSLKSTEFRQLDFMHSFWTGVSAHDNKIEVSDT